MRLLVVHNAKAGHDRDRRDGLVAALERASHSTVVVCKGQADIRQMVTNEPPDAVVVLGGDGSVTATARELIGTDVPIVPLPVGTANNLALFLDAGDDPLPALVRGRRVWLDVGVCSLGGREHVFLEGAGWGPFPETVALLTSLDADAMVDGREDELERDGRILKETAERAAARWCYVTLDDREVTGRWLLVETMNIGNIGPNLRLAPDADPADGLLDVAMVDEVEREEFADFLSRRISERSLPSPFTVTQAARIRIRMDEVVSFHVDDQLIEPEEPLDVTIWVRPKAVVFLI